MPSLFRRFLRWRSIERYENLRTRFHLGMLSTLAFGGLKMDGDFFTKKKEREKKREMERLCVVFWFWILSAKDSISQSHKPLDPFLIFFNNIII